jgi:membrane protein DedA with SNARE-associated domain
MKPLTTSEISLIGIVITVLGTLSFAYHSGPLFSVQDWSINWMAYLFSASGIAVVLFAIVRYIYRSIRSKHDS